ncbi:hypothetical protein BGZ76_005360 [Entomortierella beljakovae]|nr:hypothetical protein BGZ76_005360 [Entomortierella beljakovae]
MAQAPMTYRPMDNEDEAPPSYEAAISNTNGTSTEASEYHQYQQYHQYPMMQANSEGDGALPPPINYYPTMANIPSSPSTHTVAAPYSQYPAMPILVSQNQTVAPYPTMPTQSFSTPYPSPFANPYSPYSSPPQNQPSAPIALIDDSIDSSALGHQHIQQENMIPQDSNSYQSEDLIRFDDEQEAVALPVPTSSPPPNSAMLPALNSAMSPTLNSAMSPAHIPAIELVTSYKCKKCGAILESETAVCKRLHTPTTLLSERQIRNATKNDLDERTRRDNEAEAQGSSISSQSSLERSRSCGSSIQSNDSRQDSRRSEEQSTSRPLETVPSHENNFGTDDTYFRTPFTAIKKLWRDSNKEAANQRSESQRRSVAHEIVAPPPLPYPVYEDSTTLGRSNTYAGSRTRNPPYNPSHAPLSYPTQSPM